jgi:hypothetical protein
LGDYGEDELLVDKVAFLDSKCNIDMMQNNHWSTYPYKKKNKLSLESVGNDKQRKGWKLSVLNTKSNTMQKIELFHGIQARSKNEMSLDVGNGRFPYFTSSDNIWVK